MNAHRLATPLASDGAHAGSWLALVLGAPASIALGFVAGWLLAAAVLRSVEHAVLDEAGV